MTSERGAPPGSLRYFAVLFAAEQARPLLDALYDFEAEVRKTVLSSSHDVVHARLQWWRGEIDRLAAGRPTHPVTTALQPLRDRKDVEVSQLHETLVAADLDLSRFTYQAWDELEAYCHRASGSLQTLAAAALAGDRAISDAERRFARQLGSALRQAEMVRDFHFDLRRGTLYLPLQVIEAAGLDPMLLPQARDDARLTGLIDEWRSRVTSSLSALPASLPEGAQRRAQRHGLVLAALHERQLRRAAHDPGTDARPEIGPLTRLWTAWRTAVRYN